MSAVRISGKTLGLLAATADRLGHPDDGRIDSLPMALPDGTDATKVSQIAAMMHVDDVAASLYVLEAKDAPVALRKQAAYVLQTKGLMPAPLDDKDGVALMLKPSPDDAKEIARTDGLAPDELHVTLCYYGKVGTLSDTTKQHMMQAFAEMAKDYEPFIAKLNGITRFSASNVDPIVVNVDSPIIEQLRHDVTATNDWNGWKNGSEHGFTPHMTVGYTTLGSRMPVQRWKPMDVLFDRLTLAWGGTYIDFPLGKAVDETKAFDPTERRDEHGRWLSAVTEHLQSVKQGDVRIPLAYGKTASGRKHFAKRANLLLSGRATVRKPGKVMGTDTTVSHNCHVDTAKGWKQGHGKIVTGFAYDNYDKAWYEHSWLEAPDGTQLETSQHKPSMYYGVTLNHDEAQKFAKAEGVEQTKAFNPDELRDSHGRWTQTRAIIEEAFSNAGSNRSVAQFGHADELRNFWPEDEDENPTEQKISVNGTIGKRFAQRIEEDPELQKARDAWVDQDVRSILFQAQDAYRLETELPSTESSMPQVNRNWVRWFGVSFDDYHAMSEEERIKKVSDYRRDSFVTRYTRRYIDTWAQTSGDHDAVAVAIQYAAKEALTDKMDMEPTLDHLENKTKAREVYEQEGPLLRAMAEEMYANTQQYLKDKGITEVTVRRGMFWEPGKRMPKWLQGLPTNGRWNEIDYQMQPLSSWTTDSDTARSFSEDASGDHIWEHSAIFVAKFPASHVFSTPLTGNGCLSEREFVMLGSNGQAMVSINMNDAPDDEEEYEGQWA